MEQEYQRVWDECLGFIRDNLSGKEGEDAFTTWFKNLDDSTKQLIVKIGAIVAAIAPALLIGGKVVSGIGKIPYAGTVSSDDAHLSCLCIDRSKGRERI